MSRILYLYIIIVICLFIACKRNQNIEQIPTGIVNLTLDLNLPNYAYLKNNGNWGFFSGGVKGVIVLHDFDGSWYAYERTCAFEPLGTCNKLQIDSNIFNFRCGNYNQGKFEACCSSNFLFNGLPSKGPAVGRLATYNIQLNGNLLIITN